MPDVNAAPIGLFQGLPVVRIELGQDAVGLHEPLHYPSGQLRRMLQRFRTLPFMTERQQRFEQVHDGVLGSRLAGVRSVGSERGYEPPVGIPETRSEGADGMASRLTIPGVGGHGERVGEPEHDEGMAIGASVIVENGP